MMRKQATADMTHGRRAHEGPIAAGDRHRGER
jgi:hypothetical protein